MGPKYSHKCYKREAGRNVTTDEKEAMWYKEGVMSKEMQAFPETRKGKETDFPITLQMELALLTNTLLLATQDSFWTSGLQNSKIISVLF